MSSFIGLAYEGISSFLHHKGNKALHKAVKAMDGKTTIHHNKFIQLENSMFMYSVYNADILEKLIDMVHQIHNTTSSHERLFAGQQSSLTLRSLYANALGLQHYSINSLLHLRTVQDKYITLYKELITQLCVYATSIRILAKGYLPISLITPSKLKEILSKVKVAIRKTNPDYDLVIDRIHLYYDMKLVNFSIDEEGNLIIQFPVFIQPYKQQPLILYQTETEPVPIIDQNTEAHSYTCKTLTYITLVLTIIGLVMVAILHYRKSKLCRGGMFSNTVKSWYLFQMYNIIYLLNYAKPQEVSICSKS